VHELAVTRNIVEVVCEKAGSAKVLRVTLEIGRLSAVMPDAVRFCFDIVAKGTAADGAALEIREVPGRGRCGNCGSEMALEQLFGHCECGSNEIDCIAGQELKIKEMVID
jgi:hydrogenase nickel incorporation protein HypA/HybF